MKIYKTEYFEQPGNLEMIVGCARKFINQNNQKITQQTNTQDVFSSRVCTKCSNVHN